MRLTGLLAATLLITACAEESAVAPEPPLAVLAAPVEFVASETLLRYAGEVRPRVESALGFRLEGKLLERRVDVGSVVKKGTVLARLDPRDIQLALTAAEAEVASAEADLRFAEQELDRARTLAARDSLSKSTQDERINRQHSAAAALQSARARLAQVRNQTAYAELVADYDGVVTVLHADVGQVLQIGDPVLRFARLDDKEVLIHVPERRLAAVAAASDWRVTFTALPGKSYNAKVREMEPQADPITRTFAAKLTLLNADSEVRLGMSARVSANAGAALQVARVPAAALGDEAGRPVVWVVDKERSQVQPRAVKTGAYRGDSVEVVDGIERGETIVLAGVQKLSPGQTVRVFQQ